MDYIETKYTELCKTQSDINEHLPTLMELSKQCETICEFGVRSIVSTWAFLTGLKKNNSNNKKLVSVDIENINGIQNVINIASVYGIKMNFICEDSVKCEIPETDMLFIDTWHIYGHLKRELEVHNKKVRKYIAMHDTELDGIYGETIRCGWNASKQSETSGYPVEEINMGLQKAVDEFLETNKEWELYKVYKNNNGLTILKRKNI
jgi:hypothetical protein